jgi:hypothetical protein
MKDDMLQILLILVGLYLLYNYMNKKEGMIDVYNYYTKIVGKNSVKLLKDCEPIGQVQTPGDKNDQCRNITGFEYHIGSHVGGCPVGQAKGVCSNLKIGKL